jgi:hypothetical protein
VRIGLIEMMILQYGRMGDSQILIAAIAAVNVRKILLSLPRSQPQKQKRRDSQEFNCYCDDLKWPQKNRPSGNQRPVDGVVHCLGLSVGGETDRLSEKEPVMPASLRRNIPLN